MQDDAKKNVKAQFFQKKEKCGDISWTRALDAIHIINFIWPKPSDSADFAYSSSLLLSLTTIATKLAEKKI